MWFIYLVSSIVWGIVWGKACNKVLENKGYHEDWFWWGFWFGFIPFIIVLTKPDANYGGYAQVDRYGNVNSYGNSVLSQMAKERTEAEIMRNGGWKCSNCGRTNAGYVGSCACGWTKYQSEAKLIEAKKSAEENANKEQNAVSQEMEKIEVLKKYKELLDMGAISQEEFDKKKSSLFISETVDESSNKDTEEASVTVEKTDMWVCDNCGKENTSDRKSCRYCGAVKMM